ncbi:MAG: hypothetical protein GY809_05665 [Planctomycetes bacterium]|nr:hypothetical protein [Planctomycetota bacterium]
MHKTIAGLILGLACTSAQAYVPVDQGGDWERSLNGQWRFMLNGPETEFYKLRFDVSQWPALQVPGHWELQGFEAPLYKEPREGVGLYRRQFQVPAAWKDRRVFIRFEGVLYGFECWINGQHAGYFESAFNRSEFDITDLIYRHKANVLAVRVYRRFRGWQFDTFDAWGISGIYRDVSLFSVNETHIENLTVVTDVSRDLSKASVRYTAAVACAFFEGLDGNVFELSCTLTGPDVRIVSQKRSSINRLTRDATRFSVSTVIDVDTPMLWNAETPNLYALKVDLTLGADVLHTVTQKVGIRQVSIDGDVFKLNHRAIKLRGVNHHDIHPAVGRAMREAHYRQDVELMKKGNINAVRTSHYPPHPMFLDLCDQYGLYVICEVPFGFGDKNLKDPSFKDILLKRAEATVARDKNHASVLLWSIGNENPITPIVIDTADRVKVLDPTRFRLLPGAQDSQGRAPATGDSLTEFAEKTKFILDLPESVEIAAPHYPYVKEIPDRDRKINLTDLALDTSIQRPVICTEYNHSLGSAFEGLKAHWEMIEKYDRLGGAFIWNWADQGLKRKTTDQDVITDTVERLTVGRDEPTICADVWVDDKTVLDSHGGSGSDGIVYADRFPQVDYWITRKVYSRVVIPEDKLVVRGGKQTVELTLFNRYDFINLDRLKGTWALRRDGELTGSGDIQVSVPPHGQGRISLELDLKPDVDVTEHLLQLVFLDPDGRQIYERSVHLVPETGKVNFGKRLASDIISRPIRTLPPKRGASRYQIGHFVVQLDQARGRIEIRHADSDALLLAGPMVRVGRPAIMAEWRNYPRYNVKFWEKSLLTRCRVLESTAPVKSARGIAFEMKLNYPSLDNDRGSESIQVDLRLAVSAKGWVDVAYELTPQNATGNFLDFGLAFELPDTMTHLAWVGDGPFNSYPGQSEAAERGIWQVGPRPVTDPEGRMYQGNRAHVDLAAVTDGSGHGIGVVCDASTLSLEARARHQILSQVLRSSGKGNKTGGMMTLLPVKAAEIKRETGTLRLVPLEARRWPRIFKEVLGQSSGRARRGDRIVR